MVVDTSRGSLRLCVCVWVENERFGRRGGNIRGRLSFFDVFCKLGKEFRDVWGTRKC